MTESVLKEAKYAEVLSSYCQTVPSDFIKKAVREDMNGLIKYLETLSLKFLDDLTQQQLVQYRELLVEKKTNPRSITHTMNNIGRFFSYLYKQGHIDENPARNLREPSNAAHNNANGNQENNLPGVNSLKLDEDEVTSLIESVETDGLEGVCHKAIMQLLFTTTLKPMELINLKRKYFIRSGRYHIFRFPQKVGHDRSVSINFDCKKAIEHYFHLCAAEGIFLNEDDYLFRPVGAKGNYITKTKFDLRALEQLIIRYLRKTNIRERLSLHPWKNVLLNNTSRDYQEDNSENGGRRQNYRRRERGNDLFSPPQHARQFN